ncbi:hypothetical protein M378DRAFT_88068, partial [Amanita muscaria Koide BX008]
NIARVLPAMDKIDEVLATNATETNYLPAIKAALAIGSKLLNHYYELTDVSDVYRIATILHPSYKLEYLRKANWPEKWIDEAVSIVKEEFLRSYAEMEAQEMSASTATNVKQLFSHLSDMVEMPKASIADELAAYLEQDRERVQDVLGWWKKKQVEFPRLSQMAIDFHCVPATSVDVERAFSQGRLLLSHIRNRLSAESTQSLLCLGAWFKAGLVQTNDILAASKLPELQKSEDFIELVESDSE